MNLITVPTLAVLLGRSEPAIRASIRRGDIPGAKRIGKRYYIDLDVFAASFQPCGQSAQDPSDDAQPGTAHGPAVTT